MACRARRGRRKRRALGLVGVVVALLLVATPAAVQAEDPPPAPALGDCWGGVLTENPVHCYFLEAAQQAGHLTVAAIYAAPSSATVEVLYIYLAQTEPISEAAAADMRTQAHEYLDQYWAAVGYDPTPLVGEPGFGTRNTCVRSELALVKDCLLDASWDEFSSSGSLPRANGYETILLRVGGAKARRTEPGWGSWRQVWPAAAPVAQRAVARQVAAAASAFDLSDVDVTTFPELDCNVAFPGESQDPAWASCHAWQRHPSEGVAGVYSHRHAPEVVYFWIKNAPTDRAGLKALKDRLAPDHRDYGTEIVIVPAPYDFGELWRWATILDRVALSAGNTAGIRWAGVAANIPAYPAGTLWLETGPGPVDESGGRDDPLTLRLTILIQALDPERVAAALPAMLGIPLDAVGAIVHLDLAPQIHRLLPGITTVTAPASDAPEMTSPPPRPIPRGAVSPAITVRAPATPAARPAPASQEQPETAPAAAEPPPLLRRASPRRWWQVWPRAARCSSSVPEWA